METTTVWNNNEEIYDLDVVLFRGCFAAEKKIYYAELPDKGVIQFSSKKEYNEWLKTDPGTSEFWVEHVVEPVENAIQNCKTIIEGCHNALGGLSQRFFLSGPNNFRYGIATVKPYKGNRDPKHRPVWLQEARDWAVKHLFADIADGCEADDLVGIASVRNPQSVIISNDKDLGQLVGWHYNFVTKEGPYYVSPKDAKLFFYEQVIAGDSTDNIPGLEGVGPAGARRLLEGVSSPSEAENRALAAYREKYGKGEGDRRFLETGRLVKIRTSVEETLWEPKWVKLEIPHETNTDNPVDFPK